MTTITLMEVFKAADGELSFSSYLLPGTIWCSIIGYRITGVSEVIEGEPTLVNAVYIFMTNPATYPAEHEDIYGQQIDRDALDGVCKAYLDRQFHNIRDVLITPL